MYIQLTYTLFHVLRFERDFDLVHDTLSVVPTNNSNSLADTKKEKTVDEITSFQIRSEGGEKGGGGMRIGMSRSRSEEALDMLDRMPAPPPPLEQLGYLTTPHHLKRIGRDSPRGYGVGDHVYTNSWPEFTVLDCMK